MKKLFLTSSFLLSVLFGNASVNMFASHEVSFPYVKNAKTLVLNLEVVSPSSYIKIKRVNHKNNLKQQLNLTSNIINFRDYEPGTYLVSVNTDHEILDYLIQLTKNELKVLDTKMVSKPSYQQLKNKFKISVFNTESPILVEFMTQDGETVFSKSYSPKELSSKVFSINPDFNKFYSLICFEGKEFKKSFTF